MLSALAAVRGSINKLPSNGGITDTKGGRQNGDARDILVTVVFSFWCGKGQCNTASIVGNFGSDWLDCVAVNYWHRLVLNLDDLSASHCIARLISKLPSNGGITDTKGRRQNGGTRDFLVAVILRFWCSKGQSNTTSIVCNLGSDWLDCVAVYYWRIFV